MIWLIPSTHGDIALEKTGPKSCRLHAFELTPNEEQAMTVLREHATKSPLVGEPWATETAFRALTSTAYRTREGVRVDLAAPLDKVEAVLAKALKPGRELVRAVRFQDGKLTEVTTAKTDDVADAAAAAAGEAKAAAGEAKAAAAVAVAASAKAGATVAQPNQGCPMPDFPAADIRASRVLETFLSVEQLRDYRATGGFVVRGADTGRRYLVCNREAPALMRDQARRFNMPSFRQIYDLDRGEALCFHDWSVPPPEEMLAFLFCLTLVGRETTMLRLPEMDEELAMRDVDPAHWPTGWKPRGHFS
jgi:hypothetical protein